MSQHNSEQSKSKTNSSIPNTSRNKVTSDTTEIIPGSHSKGIKLISKTEEDHQMDVRFSSENQELSKLFSFKSSLEMKKTQSLRNSESRQKQKRKSKFKKFSRQATDNFTDQKIR